MRHDELSSIIDHTLLAPEATTADITALVAEAARLRTYSVCVSPSHLPLSVPDHVKVAAVCGFPSGTHTATVKATEARAIAAAGADEIDMVINLGALRGGDIDAVRDEIALVRQAATNVVLKVIIESAVLSDPEIVSACRAAEDGGADFVKTSTGFHPAGGASTHAVELMRKTVGDRLGVKASGGIRTLADARAMIEAGASRLGCSASAQILAELDC
ncbi:deoxyribose-phosphate aldolase [Nanchangia anserum]|uniref:Deoxyribose-phosphate aldolase n=1 Tax=Nanchangia anserum TaxID=2692125 RepID=A0A8I0GCB5_9ACTO|nr:deoxyribose-phosphate aldolase [Nanchangia anserum]MBD3689656.1 deoxyribose-phosphate aldolase [Nanchangia anserum]QOX81837.1 deoxyribose-phosphate aldolase [Nanchangia anserum]